MSPEVRRAAEILRAGGLAVLALACFGGPVAAERPIPVSQRVKACDREISLAAAEEIVNSPNLLKERLHLQFAAGALFDHGRKDEAVFWYWLAHVGSWYRPSVPKPDYILANVRLPIAGPIVNYGFQDTKRLDEILLRVQERDRDLAGSAFEKREEVNRDLADLRARIAAQREEIEAQARAAAPKMEQERAAMRARACLRVLVHPADAPRLIAAERAVVLEFVKNQPEVGAAVGMVQRASVLTFTIAQDHVLPYEYEVAVEGSKVMFAIVDVSRDASAAQLRLVCVTQKSFAHRDLQKDRCKQ